MHPGTQALPGTYKVLFVTAKGRISPVQRTMMQQRTVIWKTSDRVLQRHLHQGEADPFMYLDFSLTLASLRANVGKTRAKRADVTIWSQLEGTQQAWSKLPPYRTHPWAENALTLRSSNDQSNGIEGHTPVSRKVLFSGRRRGNGTPGKKPLQKVYCISYTTDWSSISFLSILQTTFH